MIRGYFIGLCVLLPDFEYPPLLAAQLAVGVLEDARQVSRMYRRHVRLVKALAVATDEPAEVLEIIDQNLEDPQLTGVFLTGVSTEELFGPEAWDRCGPFLIPLWAAALITIAVTVDQWECVLLGVDPPDSDGGRPACS